MNSIRVAVCCIVLCSAIALAETPMAGNWKFNPAKSRLNGGTMTLTTEAGGMIKLTEGGQSYSFKLDGSDAMTPFGRRANYKKIDDSTWESTYHKGAVLVVTAIWKLSPDGKHLVVTTKGTKPDGTHFDDEDDYVRESGDKGFEGRWKDMRVSQNSPTGSKIEEQGDGIVWTLPDFKATVTMKFDGKDYAPTGPTVPEGLTLALTKAGPREYKLVEKMKGKPVFTSTITIAADGKTMTEVGGPVGVNEPTTAVYDKL